MHHWGHAKDAPVRVEDGGQLAPRGDRSRILGGHPIATRGARRRRVEPDGRGLDGPPPARGDELGPGRLALHVTCDGRTAVVSPGQAVIVPPGALARYEAPIHARMLFVYGPSRDGHAMTDGHYEELPIRSPSSRCGGDRGHGSRGGSSERGRTCRRPSARSSTPMLGSPVVATSGVRGGFSPGPAVRADLADGRTVFVKAAGTALNPHSPLCIAARGSCSACSRPRAGASAARGRRRR